MELKFKTIDEVVRNKAIKNFSISEMTYSPKAYALGIKNQPSFQIEMNMALFLANVLQPLRDEFYRPIYINSGYRSSLLNDAVGGVPASYHMLGLAADITGGTQAKNREIVDILAWGVIPFDKVIVYDYNFIHIQLRMSLENRGMILNR